VRVGDAEGEERVQVRPAESQVFGKVGLDVGTDGFAAIHAGNSKSLFIADAVRFMRK